MGGAFKNSFTPDVLSQNNSSSTPSLKSVKPCSLHADNMNVYKHNKIKKSDKIRDISAKSLYRRFTSRSCSTLTHDLSAVIKK